MDDWLHNMLQKDAVQIALLGTFAGAFFGFFSQLGIRFCTAVIDGISMSKRSAGLWIAAMAETLHNMESLGSLIDLLGILMKSDNYTGWESVAKSMLADWRRNHSVRSEACTRLTESGAIAETYPEALVLLPECYVAAQDVLTQVDSNVHQDTPVTRDKLTSLTGSARNALAYSIRLLVFMSSYRWRLRRSEFLLYILERLAAMRERGVTANQDWNSSFGRKLKRMISKYAKKYPKMADACEAGMEVLGLPETNPGQRYTK